MKYLVIPIPLQALEMIHAIYADIPHATDHGGTEQ